MSRYEFDMKLSPMLTAVVSYIKFDYINEAEIRYVFHYNCGKLLWAEVFKDDENGEVDWEMYYGDELERFNKTFWKLAPKRIMFDDCRWERKYISFSTEYMYNYPYVSTEC